MHPADTAADNRENQGKLVHLSAAIQHTHQAMEDINDPQIVSQLSAALNTLTTVQEKCHQPYAGPARHPLQDGVDGGGNPA